VDDGVGPVAVDRPQQAVAVEGVGDHRGDPEGLEAAGAGRVAGQAEDLVAVGEELAADGDPDGAGGPDEQDLHVVLPRMRAAMATSATRVSSPREGTSLSWPPRCRSMAWEMVCRPLATEGRHDHHRLADLTGLADRGGHAHDASSAVAAARYSGRRPRARASSGRGRRLEHRRPAQMLVEEPGRQAHGPAEAGLDRQAELVDLEQLQPLGLPGPVVGPEDLVDGMDLVVHPGHEQQRGGGEAVDEVQRRPQQHLLHRGQGDLVAEAREQLLGLGDVAGQLGVVGGQGGDAGALAGLEAPLEVLLEQGADGAELAAAAGLLQRRPGVEQAGVLPGDALDPPVEGAGHHGHAGGRAVAPEPDPVGVDLGPGAQVGDAGS
jgi:hypothetical protein